MTTGPVVLTVSPGSFPGLADGLLSLGVAVEEHPLLTFAPPTDWTLVDDALRHLTRYDAVAFTSPRAATAFIDRHRAMSPSLESEASAFPAVWSGGRGTAAALEPLLVPVLGAPESESGRLGAAAALAAAMLGAGVAGPVLFPCGEIRRDELPTRLRHEGVEVDEVVCYRSVLAGEAAARAAASRASLLVVASPSVAELLARVVDSRSRPAMLAIGPTTGAAARASGWPPAAVAARPEVDALVVEARAWLQQMSSKP